MNDLNKIEPPRMGKKNDAIREYTYHFELDLNWCDPCWTLKSVPMVAALTTTMTMDSIENVQNYLMLLFQTLDTVLVLSISFPSCGRRARADPTKRYQKPNVDGE